MFPQSGRPTANGSHTPPLRTGTSPSAASPPTAAARKNFCSTLSSSPSSTIGRATGSICCIRCPSRVAPYGRYSVLPLEGERKPSLVVERGTFGKLSPDGRWLAYSFGRIGQVGSLCDALWRRAGQVAGLGERQGNAPQWSKDGKELYYMDVTYNLFSVPVSECGRRTAIRRG